MAERKIAGRTFAVSPMPARDALALYADLIAALGSAVHHLPTIILATAEASEGEGESAAPNVLADIAAFAAVADIVRSATPEGSADLVKRICEIAEIRTESGALHTVDFDRDFTGNLKDIVPVAKFVLQEQFRDFFPEGGVSGILAKVKAGFLSTRSAASPPT